MKKAVQKFRLLAFILFVSTMTMTAKAQTTETSKIVAVLNRADWCPVCKANETRIMQDVIPRGKDFNVQFIINDLTNKNTIDKSKSELEKYNAFENSRQVKPTGVIIFIDRESGKILKTVSIAEPPDKIIQTMKELDE